MSRLPRFFISKFILLSFLLLWLAGCNFPDRPPAPTPKQISPTETASVKTELPEALATVLPSPTPGLNSDSPQQGVQSVKIFLVALEDNGQSGKKIGCNDSLVPVEVQLASPTQAVLRTALEALLSVNSQYYGESGLYNSLYQSHLVIDKIVLENGEAVIRLKGELKLGGVCDSPRFQAQLEETARQFPTVNRVKIFINNIPLDKVLSGQG